MEESFERTVKKIEKRNKEQRAAINFTYTDGEPTQKGEEKGEEGSEEESDDEG